jgi:Rod binding domain-containing protein
MATNRIEGLLAGQPVAARSLPSTPHNLDEVAAQFEALLIAELLRHARESGGGNLDEQGSESSQAMLGYAEQQISQVIASGGGLGFGRLLKTWLEGADASSTESGPVSKPD